MSVVPRPDQPRTTMVTAADSPVLHIDRSNTILYCDRWRETVGFYADGLRLPVSFRGDWMVEFELAAGVFLSVADASRTSIAGSGGAGITLTWRVPDLDEARERLRAAGLAPEPIADHPWGGRSFFLFDPEGHRLEVWSEG